MDWTTILVAVLSALLSGGGIAGLMFFKENKRAKQLENETTASSQWRELYLDAKGEIRELNNKIDGLYKTIGDLRNLGNGLKTQNAVLTTLKCENVACSIRIPPLAYRKECENKNEKIE